jgi:DNA polymerase-1
MERPDITLSRLDEAAEVPVFLDWLTDALGSGATLSIDTETCSIEKKRTYGRGYCRLWQIGTGSGGWAIDSREWHGLVGEAMRRVVRSGRRVVLANAKFDQLVFRNEGWPVLPWSQTDDVITMHRVMFPQEKQHGLKEASIELLGRWAGAGRFALERFMKANGFDWDTVPTDAFEYWGYGVFDTCLTAMLYDHLADLGIPDWYHVEYEYQRLTWGMEQRGIRVDPDAIEYADAVWGEEVGRRTDELRGLGFTSPSSSKAVQHAFQSLGFEPSVFSAMTGNPSYNKFVLEYMEGLGGPVGEAAEALMAYRRAAAWRNNYGTKLLRYMDKDCILHPDIWDMEARTGRSSIRNPPLQTIPKHRITRNIFVPEQGQEFWAIDYSSQEIRVLAALSGDPAMLEFFRSDVSDYHQYVADMASIPRKAAKTVNYARAYGAGVAKLAASAKVDEETMAGYLDRIDHAFPRAIQYKMEVTAEAERRNEEDGYPWVELPYGRRAALDPGKEYTQALNTQIQGHGADVLKYRAVCLAGAGFEQHLVLPVHDEMLFTFPAGEGEGAAREAAKIMVDNKLVLPLTVDVTGPLTRWGDSIKDDE